MSASCWFKCMHPSSICRSCFVHQNSLSSLLVSFLPLTTRQLWPHHIWKRPNREAPWIHSHHLPSAPRAALGRGWGGSAPLPPHWPLPTCRWHHTVWTADCGTTTRLAQRISYSITPSDYLSNFGMLFSMKFQSTFNHFLPQTPNIFSLGSHKQQGCFGGSRRLCSHVLVPLQRALAPPVQATFTSSPQRSGLK